MVGIGAEGEGVGDVRKEFGEGGGAVAADESSGIVLRVIVCQNGFEAPEGSDTVV
jgi:hypothetical protein